MLQGLDDAATPGRPGVLGYLKAKMGGLKDTYMQLTISKEEKLEILGTDVSCLIETIDHNLREKDPRARRFERSQRWRRRRLASCAAA